MHRPPLFREDRVEVLHALIARHPFACLVRAEGDGFEASHLPMLLDPEPAPLGTLIGHLAKVNPMLAGGRDDVPALAVFAGPHGYVSPSWYPSKQAHGKVVPTWNYVAVHAHGRLRRFDDPARLRALVDRLTDTHEAGSAAPWATRDAPDEFIAQMLKGIVGLELVIERLEGQRKLSQNRPAEDRAGVVAALAASDDPADRTLAEAVRET
jgi:transcriptional regulator